MISVPTPRNLLRLALLLLAGCGLAVLVVRAAAAAILVQTGSQGGTTYLAIAADEPEVVLAGAMREFAANQGRVSPQTMAAVGEAARTAPLDGRPYVLFAVRALVRADDARALAMLEAGRRLDGRQRWTRLLLLDRYLRTRRYADATSELGALSRLVTSAQSPIVAQLVQMAQDPATREPVRQMLARDPALEAVLLTTLARGGPDPDLLFAIASPAGRAVAGVPGGWGEALVGSMVAQGRFAAARAIWRRIHGIAADTAAAPLYDAALRGAPGGPPFNWTFVQGGIGAADRGDGKVSVEYYGRENGVLLGQLLMLPPGRYRFDYSIESGAASQATQNLAWTVACVPGGAPVLANAPLPAASGAAQRLALSFAVPATGCAAQQLSLNGASSEFPATVEATLTGLSLRREGARP